MSITNFNITISTWENFEDMFTDDGINGLFVSSKEARIKALGYELSRLIEHAKKHGFDRCDFLMALKEAINTESVDGMMENLACEIYKHDAQMKMLFEQIKESQDRNDSPPTDLT